MKSNLPPTISDSFDTAFADAKVGFLKRQEKKRAFFLGYHACFHGLVTFLKSGPTEQALAEHLASLDSELADYLKKLAPPEG